MLDISVRASRYLWDSPLDDPTLDIRTVPSSRSILKPEFMRDCSRVIDLCDNLVSFTCTPPVLQCFLLDLQDKPSLQHIRFNGNMTRDQAELFVKIQGLKSITLDAGSTHAVDVLPRWTTALKTTLTELTLYVSILRAFPWSLLISYSASKI